MLGLLREQGVLRAWLEVLRLEKWAGPQFMGALDFLVGAPHRGGREPGEAFNTLT